MPQGRGKKRRPRVDVDPGGGATPERVMEFRRAMRPSIDAVVKRATVSLDEFRGASRAITAKTSPFLEADAITRSTLQTEKFSAEERALLDAQAPPYMFRDDDALCYRTPNGYKPTGLGALNFACIAETRAFWRRAFGCQLPTLPDLEGAEGHPASA